MSSLIYTLALPMVIVLVVWHNYMTRQFIRRHQALTDSTQFSTVFIDASVQSKLVRYLWRREYTNTGDSEIITLCEAYRSNALLAVILMFLLVSLTGAAFLLS